MMSNDAMDWLSRKLAQRIATIAEPIEAKANYYRHHGPRESRAGIAIKAEPAPSFNLTIPDTSEPDFRWAIEDTIMTRLLAHYSQPILGIHITVTEVIEDEVSSSYNAFAHATNEAMDQVLTGPKGLTNIKWTA